MNITGGRIACALKRATPIRKNLHSELMAFSHDGKVSVLASTERYGALDFSLSSYDTENDKKITRAWQQRIPTRLM
jgi:hypothetical protein